MSDIRSSAQLGVTVHMACEKTTVAEQGTTLLLGSSHRGAQ